MAKERERYSIVKRLDKGGMAEVFLGRSTSLEGFDKNVAIKRVLPNFVSNEKFVNMFLDEAKLSLHLDHANIVSVFDVGRSGGTYFIVMEYIDGTNLKKLIDHRAMPVDLACYVMIEVCKGLVYAHEKQDRDGRPLRIVHRDVSPPNILLSREGEVKLTDFGLARAASQLEATDPGVVKGKFAYLAPEAALGEEVDHRADIFAAGIVLWEAVAGQRLFQGETDLETLENVREGRVRALTSVKPDVPASLERILQRALAHEPSQRYQSARELGRELGQFLVEQRVSVTAYDLAAWMQEEVDMPAEVPRLSSSMTERAVLAELEDFERIGDSGVSDTDTATEPLTGSSFEDPRLWGGVLGESEDKDFDAFFDDDAPSGRLATQKFSRPAAPQAGSGVRRAPIPGSTKATAPPPTPGSTLTRPPTPVGGRASTKAPTPRGDGERTVESAAVPPPVQRRQDEPTVESAVAPPPPGRNEETTALTTAAAPPPTRAELDATTAAQQAPAASPPAPPATPDPAPSPQPSPPPAYDPISFDDDGDLPLVSNARPWFSQLVAALMVGVIGWLSYQIFT